MKLKQVISVLFISLVFINLVHNVIPHHHHSDDIYTHEGCEDHDRDIADLETEDPCTHCHAYNDIQYFPLSVKIKILPLKHMGNDFFILSSADLNTEPVHFGSIHASVETHYPYRGLDRRVTSLRAPPSGC